MSDPLSSPDQTRVCTTRDISLRTRADSITIDELGHLDEADFERLSLLSHQGQRCVIRAYLITHLTELRVMAERDVREWSRSERLLAQRALIELMHELAGDL